MSRSFKRFPHIADSGAHRAYFKQYANKRVRAREREACRLYELGDEVEAETIELDDGGAFKTVHESWDISDFKSINFLRVRDDVSLFGVMSEKALRK